VKLERKRCVAKTQNWIEAVKARVGFGNQFAKDRWRKKFRGRGLWRELGGGCGWGKYRKRSRLAGESGSLGGYWGARALKRWGRCCGGKKVFGRGGKGKAWGGGGLPGGGRFYGGEGWVARRGRLAGELKGERKESWFAGGAPGKKRSLMGGWWEKGNPFCKAVQKSKLFFYGVKLVWGRDGGCARKRPPIRWHRVFLQRKVRKGKLGGGLVGQSLLLGGKFRFFRGKTNPGVGKHWNRRSDERGKRWFSLFGGGNCERIWEGGRNRGGRGPEDELGIWGGSVRKKNLPGTGTKGTM